MLITFSIFFSLLSSNHPQKEYRILSPYNNYATSRLTSSHLDPIYFIVLYSQTLKLMFFP